MSNLSDLLPAGAGAKSASFTASGTLSSGQTVALQSDGTVKAISTTANPQEAGTPVVFETGDTRYINAAFDPVNNKVLVIFQDSTDSNKGKAIVGTVSGSSISFGTAVQYDNQNTQESAIAYDASTGKFLVVCTGPSRYAIARVATVSGTSVSFGGDEAVASSGNPTFYVSAVYDSSAQKIVVSWDENGTSGQARVATISGTTVSFGTAQTFESGQPAELSSAFDSDQNKVVIFYSDQGNNGKATAVVGTVSGTSITFGSNHVITTGISGDQYTRVTYDSVAQRIVFVYRDNGNSDYGTSRVAEISGTAFSMPAPVVFKSAAAQYYKSTFDTNAAKTTIAYQDNPNSGYGTAIAGTISGSTISFGSETVFESADVEFLGITYDSYNKKVVIGYHDNGNSSRGTAVVFQNSSSNSGDFIGITDQAIADTATGSVVVEGGVTEKVSGLTTGSTYYVQNDGTLSTTTSSVTAGKALSATKLLLKG